MVGGSRNSDLLFELDGHHELAAAVSEEDDGEARGGVELRGLRLVEVVNQVHLVAQQPGALLRPRHVRRAVPAAAATVVAATASSAVATAPRALPL